MRVLIDLDGVVANWGKGWDQYLDWRYPSSSTKNIPRHANQLSFDLHKGLSEDECKIVDETMDNMSYINLEPIEGAIDALLSIQALGHEVLLVTSPWLTNPNCVQDKLAWVEKHLGAEWINRVIITKDKTLIDGDILIDDKPSIHGAKIDPTWVQVVFTQPYNRDVIARYRLDDWQADNWLDVLASVDTDLNYVATHTPQDYAELFTADVDRYISNGEVRSVSSTGGEKGVKLARYDLIPVDALRQVAEHYGRGAEKYADNQWRKSYEWSKSYAALQRHATQFWGGEDFDEETGSNHMAAVAWHALALLTFFEEFPEFDDRYKS